MDKGEDIHVCKMDRSMFADFREIRQHGGVDLDLDHHEEKVSFPEKSDKNKFENESFNEVNLFNCSYCQESSLCEEEGMMVCTSCGRESGPIITTQQEWRNNLEPGKSDPSRCGMPMHPLLPHSSLGTVAQGYRKQGYRRLQMQNAMPSSERTLFEAMKIIKRAAQELKIDASLADKALLFYSQLSSGMKIKRGPVRRAFMANCQYFICMYYEHYIGKEELSAGYEIELTKYNEGFKIFTNLYYHKSHGRDKKAKWDKVFGDMEKKLVKPTKPENIIEDACRKLEMGDIQTAEVTYIVRQVERLKIVSARMPQSIAAGCLILYVKEKKIDISIYKISCICVVSDATAKNTYKEIEKNKRFLFPYRKSDLVSGAVGNCMPKVQLENIYTARKGALPKKVFIHQESAHVGTNRGRPKTKVS
jgi:transcription initiation factor TFIIIB Brf1 subunit/transcription initiation factor TFIIB